jgi:hypothetical protein
MKKKRVSCFSHSYFFIFNLNGGKNHGKEKSYFHKAVRRTAEAHHREKENHSEKTCDFRKEVEAVRRTAENGNG